MRLTAGRCYEIAGMLLRRLPVGPGEDAVLGTWYGRRADLQAESSVIAQVYRTWTAEDNGLWNAMRRELDAVNETITHLEREAPDARTATA